VVPGRCGCAAFAHISKTTLVTKKATDLDVVSVTAAGLVLHLLALVVIA
jgi:hypothetical protein